MNYLFIHQNYPGQFLHIIRHLVQDPTNQLVFISEPNANRIEGVRRAFYQAPGGEQPSTHPNARDYEQAARRAEAVATTAANLKRLGFQPDVIIGHHGWGELLNLPDVWPDTPILGYYEFYYRTDGQDVGYDPEFPTTADRFARIRAMNVVNLLALSLEQHGQTPTHWQHTRYPDWAQGRIRVIPEGANLDTCKPDAAVAKRDFSIGDFTVTPKQKLVTYVARNLEPYRGFHVMMRALPRLLRERPDAKVVLVGGDGVSYGAKLSEGTWRDYMRRELAGKYDESRVLFAGQVGYGTYLKLLQRSDAHVYLTYPFVASWSLREALACGCPMVVSDVESVTEFVEHNRTGLVVPGLDPARVAAGVLTLLEDTKSARRLRIASRRHAERTLGMPRHIEAYRATIGELTGRTVSPLTGATMMPTMA